MYFQQIVLEQLNIHIYKRMNLDPKTPHIKIYLRWVMELNVKAKVKPRRFLKTTEEKIRNQ